MTSLDDSQHTTRPSQSTEPRDLAAFDWALHWVFPRAEIVALEPGVTTIGRDAGCRCVLRGAEVSRHHASVVRSGASCRLIDGGSRNGSSVNGERLSEAELEDGSVLRLGGAVGVVVRSPHAQTAPSSLLGGSTSYIGSGKLEALVKQAQQFGPRPGPVFIQGESGSGKEMIAQQVHRASGRQGDYLPHNCANFRGDLAAAAIFGHTQGAFSGAVRAQPGVARTAHRGSLFLDEVGELSLEIQPLLLRLLQNGELTPVGSASPQQVDVRIISATHRDLWTMCREGRFREDLYFRLTPYELRVPALRERREDILALFTHFAARPLEGLSAGFVAALLCYGWPGNVRELQNFADRLDVSARSEPIWRRHLAPQAPSKSTAAAELRANALTAAEWKQLYEAHGRVAANISRATSIAVSTVKRHLQKHGLRG